MDLFELTCSPLVQIVYSFPRKVSQCEEAVKQQFQSEEPSASNGIKSPKIFCDKDAEYKAEIIWVFKSLQAFMSEGSVDGIIDLFKAMFPGKLPSVC